MTRPGAHRSLADDVEELKKNLPKLQTVPEPTVSPNVLRGKPIYNIVGTVVPGPVSQARRTRST